jgi:photosystem II stability/assembly factor-like uncharacterized protein
MAAIKQYGYIYTSSDSGVTWTARTSSGQKYWESLASSSDGTVLTAVSKNNYIYTSSDSGATWTARTSSGKRNWQYVAVTPNGKIQYTADSG